MLAVGDADDGLQHRTRSGSPYGPKLLVSLVVQASFFRRWLIDRHACCGGLRRGCCPIRGSTRLRGVTAWRWRLSLFNDSRFHKTRKETIKFGVQTDSKYNDLGSNHTEVTFMTWTHC